MTLKEDAVASFNSRDNTNTFCIFFSNLADSLLQKLLHLKSKFRIKSTSELCKQV